MNGILYIFVTYNKRRQERKASSVHEDRNVYLLKFVENVSIVNLGTEFPL